MTKLELLNELFKGRVILFEGIDYSEEADEEFTESMKKLEYWINGLGEDKECSE